MNSDNAPDVFRDLRNALQRIRMLDEDLTNLMKRIIALEAEVRELKLKIAVTNRLNSDAWDGEGGF